MTSQRLTIKKREKILDRIVDEAFKVRRDELTALEHNTGLLLLNELMTKDEKKYLKVVPPSFLKDRDQIAVTFTNDTGGCEHYYFNLPDRTKAPGNHSHYIHCSMSNPLYELACETRKAIDALKSEEKTFKRETETLLKSCTTTKVLLGAWPEIENIVLDEMNSQKTMLPAKNVDGLNKILNKGRMLEHSNG